ncbi:MAG TPA: LacI family DNA-binding transcriptional regulator [Sphingomicrobium sp.]|nr:LacI family DNA-binding transcriptional regulator [Sphingomicrobium sp.]
MAEPTIRDVARLAQVSIASVSRTLNNLGSVAEGTRRKVEDAARQLGYVPHAGARSLSLARTRAIGVVLPDTHGEFFSEVMRGMDREASARDYVLLLSNMHGAREHPEHVLRTMRGRVDGLVVMAPHLDADEVERALPPRLPAVLLNAHGGVRSHSSFGVDNAHGVRSIVDHLQAIGRQHIVHVAGPADNVDAQQRCEAFKSVVGGRKATIIPGDYSEESGIAAVRKLIDERISFDAIFAANDMMAIGAIEELRSRGIDVPGAVAVAGFDDIPLARHLCLTTARIRIDELGAHAIERLIDIIDKGEDATIQRLHAPELIVRASTAG